MRYLRVILVAGTFLLTHTCVVCAASFDCAKANSKVERMICDIPELSKLDEKLSDIYGLAVRYDENVDAIREAQRNWLRFRNSCRDPICVKGSYESRIEDFRGGKPAGWTKEYIQRQQFCSTEKPTLKFEYCDNNAQYLPCPGGAGENESVCEEYLRHLQSYTTSFPACSFSVPHGYIKLKWVEMNVLQYPELVYQAERMILSVTKGYNHPAFDVWFQTLRNELEAGKISPRLKKAIVLVNGVETFVLTYTRDSKRCLAGFRSQVLSMNGSDMSHEYFANIEDSLVPLSAHPAAQKNSVWSINGEAIFLAQNLEEKTANEKLRYYGSGFVFVGTHGLYLIKINWPTRSFYLNKTNGEYCLYDDGNEDNSVVSISAPEITMYASEYVVADKTGQDNLLEFSNYPPLCQFKPLIFPFDERKYHADH